MYSLTNEADIKERLKAERKVSELLNLRPNMTSADIAKHLQCSGFINPTTGMPYSSHSVGQLRLGEGALLQRDAARERAVELKLRGKTYRDVVSLMAKEGFVNPRTGKPYALYTITVFTLGLADQRGGYCADKRRRAKARRRSRRRRANETPEQRETRLAKQRDYYHRRKAMVQGDE